MWWNFSAIGFRRFSIRYDVTQTDAVVRCVQELSPKHVDQDFHIAPLLMEECFLPE